MGWIASLIAAALIVVAWWTPGTPECAALGWSSVVLWFAALKPNRARLKRMFVAGTVTYIGGFYWLYSTIKEFGGFPTPAALAIFALFACGSAVQFVIWGFIWQNLPAWCTKLGLRTAIAWLVANTLWIRIFPWDFGHTQIAFIPFAQIADITGVTGITALMMWVVESFVAGRAVFLTAKITSLCTIIASLGYGLWMEHRVPSLYETALKTAIIQGNISLEDKHDVKSFAVNRQRYLELSSEITQPDSLIIWPETTITDWIPSNISDARFAPVLPRPQNGEAFLVGGLTFRSQEQFFNSSILVRPDSSVDTPYNKMILMPFGEYTPFGSVFPWLQEINATAGQFTAGEKPQVLSFDLSSGARIALSPLICYEDIVPELARRATRDGAQLLINQTNDAWFGDTVAPYQHHMIASFRAIENRRFLLRSTNTGLTAVVDPLGQTRAHLQPFTEGILAMEVNLVSFSTWFSAHPIGLLWSIISIGFACAAMIRAVGLRGRG